MSQALKSLARVQAAEAAIKRYADAEFVWGKSDCVRLVAFALRELGHAPPLREAGTYTSHIGARRALKRMGHARLEDWVTSWGLTPIPAALTRPCDVVALPSEDPIMPALALVLSNRRFLGFVPEVGRACVFSLRQGVTPLAAWSV